MRPPHDMGLNILFSLFQYIAKIHFQASSLTGKKAIYMVF